MYSRTKSVEALMKYFGDDIEIDISSSSCSSLNDTEALSPTDNLRSEVNFVSVLSSPVINERQKYKPEPHGSIELSRPAEKEPQSSVAQLRIRFEQQCSIVKRIPPIVKQAPFTVKHSQPIIKQSLPSLADIRPCVDQLIRKFEPLPTQNNTSNLRVKDLTQMYNYQVRENGKRKQKYIKNNILTSIPANSAIPDPIAKPICKYKPISTALAADSSPITKLRKVPTAESLKRIPTPSKGKPVPRSQSSTPAQTPTDINPVLSPTLIKPVLKPRNLSPYYFNDRIAPVLSPRKRRKMRGLSHNVSTFAEDLFCQLSVKDKVSLYNQFIQDMSETHPQFSAHVQSIMEKIRDEVARSYENFVENRCSIHDKWETKEWKHSASKLTPKPIPSTPEKCAPPPPVTFNCRQTDLATVSDHQILYTEFNKNNNIKRYTPPPPTPVGTESEYSLIAASASDFDDTVTDKNDKMIPYTSSLFVVLKPNFDSKEIQQPKADIAAQHKLTKVDSTNKKMQSCPSSPPILPEPKAIAPATPNFVEPDCVLVAANNSKLRIQRREPIPPTPTFTNSQYTSVAVDSSSRKIKRRAPSPPLPKEPDYASIAERVVPPTSNFAKHKYTSLAETVPPRVPFLAEPEYASVFVDNLSPEIQRRAPNFTNPKYASVAVDISSRKIKRHVPAPFAPYFRKPEFAKAVPPPIPNVAEPEYASVAVDTSSLKTQRPILPKPYYAESVTLTSNYAEPHYVSIAEAVPLPIPNVVESENTSVAGDSTSLRIHRRAPPPPILPKPYYAESVPLPSNYAERHYISIDEAAPLHIPNVTEPEHTSVARNTTSLRIHRRTPSMAERMPLSPNFAQPDYVSIAGTAPPTSNSAETRYLTEPEYASVAGNNLDPEIQKRAPLPSTLSRTKYEYVSDAKNNSGRIIKLHAPRPLTPIVRELDFASVDERGCSINPAVPVGQCGTTSVDAATTKYPQKRLFKRALPRKRREERYQAELTKAAEAKRKRSYDALRSWLQRDYLASPTKKHCSEVLAPGMVFGSIYMKRIFYKWLKETFEQDKTIEQQMQPSKKLLEVLTEFSKLEIKQQQKETAIVDENAMNTSAAGIMNNTFIIEEPSLNAKESAVESTGFKETDAITGIKPTRKVKRQAPAPPTFVVTAVVHKPFTGISESSSHGSASSMSGLSTMSNSIESMTTSLHVEDAPPQKVLQHCSLTLVEKHPLLSDFESDIEPEIQEIMDVDESTVADIVERPRTPTPTKRSLTPPLSPILSHLISPSAPPSTPINPNRKFVTFKEKCKQFTDTLLKRFNNKLAPGHVSLVNSKRGLQQTVEVEEKLEQEMREFSFRERNSSMCFGFNSTHSTQSSRQNITVVKREIPERCREVSSSLLPYATQYSKENQLQLQQTQSQKTQPQQTQLQQLIEGSPLSIDQGFETASIEIEDSPMSLMKQFTPMKTPSTCNKTFIQEIFSPAELPPHTRRAVRRCLAHNFANQITSTPLKEGNLPSLSGIGTPTTPFSPIRPSGFSGRRFIVAFDTRRNTL